jgi:DNA invertase Pin-like site-specific DNA recombinase
MFQMMGVFAEFERSMIRERVNAGIARVKAGGKHCGRPSSTPSWKGASVMHWQLQGAQGCTRSPRNQRPTGTVQRIARAN